MSARTPVADIAAALRDRTTPTVLRWNRLEGRPRSRDFRRALKAEVRDAIWMLCRQWQVGEFEGEDAGSPVSARINVRSHSLSHYTAGDEETKLDVDQPLEPIAERMAISLNAGTQAIALDIRLALGRRWLAMLAADADLKTYRKAFIREYSVDPPNLITRNDGMLSAHSKAAQFFAAAAGRCMDGGKLLIHLRTRPASENIEGLLDQHREPLDKLGPNLISWYERVFEQPIENDAWRPERLEYAFKVDAEKRTDKAKFVAQEYHSGRIHWHSFDVKTSEPAPAEPAPENEQPETDAGPATPDKSKPFTVLPTPVQFEGMPNSRWWRFEDGRVNFGDVKTDRVDVGRLLLIEFGLVFANDWYIVPIQTDVGSISDVHALVVTNTFGDRTWVEPAGRGASHGWRGSRMFGMSPADGNTNELDHGLMLPNAAVAIMDGPPLEEVVLARDELSNLVWGVERMISLPHGEAQPGSEISAEMLAYQQKWFPVAAPVEWQAALRYELMNNVPEHWIPFVPARIPGQKRAIRLQRGVMLRAIEGDPLGPQRVRPRTQLLRNGLDEAKPYFLFEEEVPRAGARVFKAFRRTRTKGGRVITWLGARKRTGRGESSSGLAFDQLRPVEALRTAAAPD